MHLPQIILALVLSIVAAIAVTGFALGPVGKAGPAGATAECLPLRGLEAAGVGTGCLEPLDTGAFGTDAANGAANRH